MRILNGYLAGANLGHWISQYDNKGSEHWDNYITKPDIARMKEWGFDHIRVPVDYFLFEDDNNPGVYREDRLKYIDNVIDWCGEYGMNMILDLHHAPGFFFGNGDKNKLFIERSYQIRFINIWKFFSERYRSIGDRLIFELLNELVWENSDPWNKLWVETAKAIHDITPDRDIIVGGNWHNSVFQLKNLVVDKNEHIIYTFHFYEPFIFTHQCAPWLENMRNYTKPVTFPFKAEDYTDFYNGDLPDIYNGLDIIDRRCIERYMQPVFDFVKETNKAVYCGEFGVISNAPDESAVNWLNTVTDILKEHNIGHAVWSYRGFSSITSPDNKSWNQAMVDALKKR
ncbi:MAG: glycoside hydrolase family 5 protein [Clostridiales bacterium]|nr:glycoside hydrolase family 5 protein [Clostridiales bacterium]